MKYRYILCISIFNTYYLNNNYFGLASNSLPRNLINFRKKIQYFIYTCLCEIKNINLQPNFAEKLNALVKVIIKQRNNY